MVAKRRFTTGLVLTILLALPREGGAFWNWLHELSGPGPFWGVVLGCTADLRFEDWCDEFTAAGFRSPRAERFRWRTEGNFAWSYRNDFTPDGGTVFWTSVNLLGEYRVPLIGDAVEIIPAIGPRVDAFYGQGMSLTMNAGLTGRVTAAVRVFRSSDRQFWVEVGPEGRVFFSRPHGSDFGVTPGTDLERAVGGVYLGLRWSR